jgi:hypothetical protein
VRDRIEALVDILGGEVGSLQKLERERLDSELAAMRDTIEALRVEVQRLRGELVRQVTDSNVPMRREDGLITTSRTFTAALLARDDRGPVKISMGLLAVVNMIVKDDPQSRSLVALQLRQMAAELENVRPPPIN